MTSSETQYQAILQKLEQRGSYEVSAKPRAISKLSGIQQLLSDLGEPHHAFKIIHIAGTTGKGLTGAMIAAILQQEGYRTGLYSSPHVADIRERIILNGKWISKKSFAQNAKRVLEQVENDTDRLYVSYFDILTALAFLAFQAAQVQYVVLETGLGGRADSTNVTDKELSVLTSIGYDHINVLGDSLQAIAQEKLGIVRKGIPTVVAAQSAELMPWLLKQLEGLQSPYVLGEQLSIEKIDHAQYRFRWPDGQVDNLELRRQQSTLPYLECLKTALMAYHSLCLPVYPHQRRAWILAAASVRLPGRLEYFEHVKYKPSSAFSTMVLDGGHNATALEALSHQLKLWQIEKYTLVLGLAQDKLIDPLKPPLASLCQRAEQIIVTQAQSSRAAAPERLKDFILSAHPSSCKEQKPPWTIETIGTSQEVLERLSAHKNQTIVISGSFYLIGEFFQALGLGLASLQEHGL